MDVIFALCTIFGCGFSYDGQLENKYYFQVNTPEADYGFVVQIEPKFTVYHDMVHYRYREMR